VLTRRQFLKGLLGLTSVALCSGLVAQTKTPAPPADARVDLNHTSVDELMKIPGMTRVWAARIVRFRPYRTKNELVDKGIVTSDVYVRIRDYVIAHREKQ
jgi:DNA uptake protein ComE-like DNA-binding protein